MPNSVDLLSSGIYSYLKPNRFRVLVDGKFMVSAHTVNLPNIVVNFSESSQYFVGSNTKLPTDVNFSELSITFYVTVQESDVPRELQYFIDWVAGKDNKGVFQKLSAGTYVLNYQEDYARDILVEQFNEAGDVVGVFKFYKCFVTSVNYSDLSYSNDNQLMEVTVNFEYDDMENDITYQ